MFRGKGMGLAHISTGSSQEWVLSPLQSGVGNWPRSLAGRAGLLQTHQHPGLMGREPVLQSEPGHGSCVGRSPLGATQRQLGNSEGEGS